MASEAGWVGLGESEEELGQEAAAFTIDSLSLNSVQTNFVATTTAPTPFLFVYSPLTPGNFMNFVFHGMVRACDQFLAEPCASG